MPGFDPRYSLADHGPDVLCIIGLHHVLQTIFLFPSLARHIADFVRNALHPVGAVFNCKARHANDGIHLFRRQDSIVAFAGAADGRSSQVGQS